MVVCNLSNALAEVGEVLRVAEKFKNAEMGKMA
jgi:hypothetical protein